SPFYPMPPINESLSATYYAAPVFLLLLLVVLFITLKKNRPIAFGILFYLVNLALVLQVFSVGSAIIADRYTYIPYIGLFYVLGCLLSRYASKPQSKAFVIIASLAIIFSFLSYRQTSILKTS